MTHVGERPVPVADETSAPYWEAAARHVLALAHCARCQQVVHPPVGVCPFCGTDEPAYSFLPLSGSGTVRSWTVIRQSFLPGFVVPYVLVDVELDAQPDLRLIGPLLEGEAPGLRLGAAVRVAFEDLRPGVSVPAFTLGLAS